MPTIRLRLRFHLEHQTAPSWQSEVVTHDECERHLRKLSRTACGCLHYGTHTSRPFVRIDMASGLSTETTVARLMLTMSADQPLQGSDFACHRCDDPLCAHPDHLYVGTYRTNVQDQFFPGRRMRVRRAARFYDELLLEIAEHSPAPAAVVIGRPRQTPTPPAHHRAPESAPSARGDGSSPHRPSSAFHVLKAGKSRHGQFTHHMLKLS